MDRGARERHAIASPSRHERFLRRVARWRSLDLLVKQFISDPRAPLDTSCASDVIAFDFKRAGHNLGEGTIDVWDNE